jgi:hypothetical protein
MTTENVIEITLVETNVLTRWPCHVCGGHTEKVEVLAEDHGGNVRVCEFCLEAGNIDDRLRKHAARLREYADAVEALIGLLKVPSYEAWQARMRPHGYNFRSDGPNPKQPQVVPFR